MISYQHVSVDCNCAHCFISTTHSM